MIPGSSRIVLGLAAASVAVLTAALAPQPEPPDGPEPPAPILTFSARAVDGVDVLILKDGKVSIEHRNFREMEGVTTHVLGPVRREEGLRVSVTNRIGRPDVRVIQQPSAENGFEVRVLIDDGPAAGASPLSFELVLSRVKVVPNPLNVVLVTLDSLRADRLGCYGSTRDTSPRLDRFAADCVRFENAFSTSSFTPPTHASILTSRYVGDHGLLTWNPLPEDQITLAEILAERDYRTGASVNLRLLSENNLGQGFEWKREGLRDGREVVSDGLTFLRQHDGRPFFLWLHLYDVHRPYGRVPGWRDYFATSDRPSVGDGEKDYNLTPQQVRSRGLSRSDLRWIVDRYDAGIAYTDAQLGPLIAEVSSPARLEDTLVIVTADHGESLLEHPERLFSHDPYLESAVTRIPLLVRFPGRRGAGRVSRELVSQIDLAPTVLALLGVKAPPSFHGLSLDGIPARRKLSRQHIFHECWGWEELKAVRSKKWLTLLDTRSQELRSYSRVKDPEEQDPLSPASLGVETLPLETELRAFATRRLFKDQPPELSEETLRRLRELGYVR